MNTEQKIKVLFNAVLCGFFAASLILLVSCDSDNFDDTLILESLRVEMLIPQKNYPVPGSGGIITTGTISQNSVQLIWTAATDSETAQADLEYRLYSSDMNNIGTPADAELNGIPATPWIRGMISEVAAGLSPGTIYFFNVLVKDSDENVSAYVTVSSTTQSVAVYMFSAGTHNGALISAGSSSPRYDMDGYCRAAKETAFPSLQCVQVRAFISLSNADCIATMPDRFGLPRDKIITGPTGLQIADNWFDLLDGTIDQSLFSAGVSNASGSWWSGSNSDGTFIITSACLSCNTCSGWTEGTSAARGLSGFLNSALSRWIADGNSNCNIEQHVLCVCW